MGEVVNESPYYFRLEQYRYCALNMLCKLAALKFCYQEFKVRVELLLSLQIVEILSALVCPGYA